MVVRARMAQQHFLANREIEMVVLALQAFQVLFSGFTIGFRLGASTMSQRYAARIRDDVSSQ